MGVIIRNGIEYSGAGMGGSCDCDEIVYLTQEDYDDLPASKESNNVEYRITNASESINAARDWAYDNAASGLEAENVQDAIDEVNDKIGEDENGMTLHEKLDILMENGSSASNVAEVYYHFTNYNQSYTTDRELYLIGKGVADGGTNTVVYIGNVDYTNPVFLYGSQGVQTIPSGTTVKTRDKDAGTYNLYLVDKMPENNTFYIKQSISF